jgi:hypothetical protein
VQKRNRKLLYVSKNFQISKKLKKPTKLAKNQKTLSKTTKLKTNTPIKHPNQITNAFTQDHTSPPHSLFL